MFPKSKILSCRRLKKKNHVERVLSSEQKLSFRGKCSVGTGFIGLPEYHGKVVHESKLGEKTEGA